jgi:hypothetical protein
LSRSPAWPLKERIWLQENSGWLIASPRALAGPPRSLPDRPPSISVAVDSSDFLRFISVFRI